MKRFILFVAVAFALLVATVPDDILARMPKNGGVVNVTFIPSFVSAATAAWEMEKATRLSAQRPPSTATIEALDGKTPAR